MKHIVVGTAGHIDHGKSALVRALTGTDPDRLQEEKARGITIDLGFAQHTVGDVNVAFVDVPGHERFVRNMLAGASGIDAVLLVIAADESVMPQTLEHFEICQLLGVGSGAVALTKSDLVDAEMVELVRLEIADLVRGSFLEGAPVVPVSSKTGIGLNDISVALAKLATRIEASERSGIGRLPIDRAFSVRGFGTVVTGTLVSGRLAANSELDLLPAGRRVRVRGLHVHGETCHEAVAGQRVAANLSNVEVSELVRGDALVDSNGLEVTRRVDARLHLLARSPALKHGARVRFHSGTSETMARISLATRFDDAADATPLNLLEAGGDAYVRVRLERPVALTRNDRFVLRAYSPPVTIAGGRVLDPAPGRGRLRTKAGFARLSRLDETDVVDAVAAMVANTAARGLALDRLTPHAGVVPSAAPGLVDELVSSGRARQLGGRLLAPEAVDGLCDVVTKWVRDYHARQPLDPGLPREEARERFSHLSAPEIFDAVVMLLVESETLTALGYLAICDHKVTLSPEEERAAGVLVERFEQAGLTPPEALPLAGESGIEPDVAERMLRHLVRTNVLCQVESQYYHASALDRLRADVETLKQNHQGEGVELDIAAFKQRYGISRKYAIPLLVYLDRKRVTRRIGNVRVVL